MTLRLITAIAVLVFSAESCSLKEDRKACPCMLTVYFGNASDSDGEAILTVSPAQSGRDVLLSGGQGFLIQESIFPSDYQYGYSEEVPRTHITVSAIQGLKNSTLSGNNVIIADGSDSDRLFIYSETIDCQCENASATARLHKGWASLEISTGNYGELSGRLEITVSGNINGIDVLSGKPAEGKFECRARLFDEDFGTYELNLPRQISGKRDLFIKMTDISEGKELLHCCLSDILENAGYDWDKENLDDIRLDFDQIDCSFTVRICDWESGTDGPVVI
ncbi:MAG: hypothetical protein ACI3ZO_04885 [Candidatus Cryptobacteroides sp.]|nr:hypothetical protein [Bacteroidales bacterium]